jgi:hypothetical protein
MFDLADARSGVPCERVNIDLTLGEDEPHTDSSMPKAIYAPVGVRLEVVLQSCHFEKVVELPLNDARGRGSIAEFGCYSPND